MVGAYLDASVIVPTFLDEPGSGVVSDWIEHAESRLLVGDLAAAEVSSALSIACRTDRRTLVEAERLLELFDLWRSRMTTRAEIDPDDIRAADAIVRRFDLKLRTPDAIHAATAHRIGATLITLDSRLLIAAEALGIAAVNPIAAHI